MTTAKQIAKAAGISPNTKRFVLTDEYGFAYDGSRNEHVLAALQRSDKTPDLPQDARIVAMGIYKSLTTARMNVMLANRVREDYSPYRLCQMVAQVANKVGPNPSIGLIADTWLNEHKDEL